MKIKLTLSEIGPPQYLLSGFSLCRMNALIDWVVSCVRLARSARSLRRGGPLCIVKTRTSLEPQDLRAGYFMTTTL